MSALFCITFSRPVLSYTPHDIGCLEPRRLYYPYVLPFSYSSTKPPFFSSLNRLVKHPCGRGRGVGSGCLARKTEAVQPSGVVELSVVGLDLAEVFGEDHMVDTHDGGLSWGSCLPSPGDGVAAVRDEEGLDLELRLEDTLAVVEGLSGTEGDTAELGHVSCSHG